MGTGSRGIILPCTPNFMPNFSCEGFPKPTQTKPNHTTTQIRPLPAGPTERAWRVAVLIIKGVRESTLSVGKSRARNPTQNPTQNPTSIVAKTLCVLLYLLYICLLGGASFFYIR